MDKDDKSPIDWGALTALSGLFIAFGAMAYTLGLLVMWIPTSKDTEDFVVSWSAVSLMPRTTVAGIGVRWSLVGGHLIYVVLSIPLWFLVRWVYLNRRKPKSIKAWAYVGIVVFFIGLVWALWHPKAILDHASDLPGLRYALAPMVMTVVLFPLLRERLKSGSISWSTRRLVLWTAAFFILLNFVTSLLVIGSVGRPGRPVAEVTGVKELRGGTRGLLWTHTEGFWYVFDKDNNLCAISDEDVRTVRILRVPEKDKPLNLTSCP